MHGLTVPTEKWENKNGGKILFVSSARYVDDSGSNVLPEIEFNQVISERD
jgi:hypothetical protein